MNDLNYLQSSVAIGTPSENNVTEQRPSSIEMSSLSESFDNVVAGNTLHSLENFFLSNYEDDDDDSGFCCSCCLTR